MGKVFTKKEQKVMDALVKAWSAYVELEVTHPQHNTDFGGGIRMCQYVIEHKVLQRQHPDEFPTHRKGNPLKKTLTSPPLKK